MYDCILVSLDGSPEAEAVLPEVEKLLRAHPATVILLNIGQPVDLAVVEQELRRGSMRPEEIIREERDLFSNASEIEIRRYLDAVGERLKAVGGTSIAEVSFNQAAEDIVFYARHYSVDLIAMATHGRTRLDRLLHGSVTEAVLEHAPCPMLIVCARR